jgi:hypothetical protein
VLRAVAGGRRCWLCLPPLPPPPPGSSSWPCTWRVPVCSPPRQRVPERVRRRPAGGQQGVGLWLQQDPGQEPQRDDGGWRNLRCSLRCDLREPQGAAEAGCARHAPRAAAGWQGAACLLLPLLLATAAPLSPSPLTPLPLGLQSFLAKSKTPASEAKQPPTTPGQAQAQAQPQASTPLQPLQLPSGATPVNGVARPADVEAALPEVRSPASGPGRPPAWAPPGEHTLQQPLRLWVPTPWSIPGGAPILTSSACPAAGGQPAAQRGQLGALPAGGAAVDARRQGPAQAPAGWVPRPGLSLGQLCPASAGFSAAALPHQPMLQDKQCSVQCRAVPGVKPGP